MQEHGNPNWQPLTIWNVGKIGGKKMITLIEWFSSHVNRPQWALDQENRIAQVAHEAARQTVQVHARRWRAVEGLNQFE